MPRTGTRPTTDRVRESLFNVLASRIDIAGASVLPEHELLVVDEAFVDVAPADASLAGDVTRAAFGETSAIVPASARLGSASAVMVTRWPT